MLIIAKQTSFWFVFSLLCLLAYKLHADPAASHLADVAQDTDSGAVIAEAYYTYPNGTVVEAFCYESIDLVNAGGYRYFGFMQASMDANSGEFEASAVTTITGLNINSDYLVFVLAGGVPGANVNTSVTVGSYSIQYGPSETSETGYPVFLYTNNTTLVMTVTADGSDGAGDASAIVSVIEVTSNTSYHNDCDINDDGYVDDYDIDALFHLVNSGFASLITDADAIAMFDLDSDDDIDINDLIELVEGTSCLNTYFGDTDLDGDVDDSDLGAAFTNYTGPVGAYGGKGWIDGDTDGDGDVDDADLGTMFTNYTGPL